jgi:hypothetical protein
VETRNSWMVAAEDVASPRLRFESCVAESGKRNTLTEEELYFRNASLLILDREEVHALYGGSPSRMVRTA